MLERGVEEDRAQPLPAPPGHDDEQPQEGIGVVVVDERDAADVVEVEKALGVGGEETLGVVMARLPALGRRPGDRLRGIARDDVQAITRVP